MRRFLELFSLFYVFAVYLRLFEPLRIYLYIGITSLCLYTITEKSIFQVAILYKLHNLNLYKIQKYALDIHFSRK